MGACARRLGSSVLVAAVAWALVVSRAEAQESLLIVCKEAGQCTYQRAFATTLAGRNSIASGARVVLILGGPFRSG